VHGPAGAGAKARADRRRLAVAAGELAPSEAADIAKVVDIYVRALATQEFEERLAKLENNPAPASVPADADA